MGEKIKVQTVVSNQLDEESSIRKDNSISNDEDETFWQKVIRVCQSRRREI